MRTTMLRVTAAARPLVAAAVLLMGGCAGDAPPGPQLPTLDHAEWICFGVGLDQVNLAGDPTDPRLAWLVEAGGNRLEAVWEPGYTARFNPDLEVLDETGRVVYRAGDVIDDYCATAGSDLVLVYPPRPRQ